MIQLKDLISDNILYSCSWEYEKYKYYVYLTKNKLYEYCYCKEEKSYSYHMYLVKDFGNISSYPMWYRPSNYADSAAHGFITITSKYEIRTVLASFEFPCSEEGAKKAEELFVAISKVIN